MSSVSRCFLSVLCFYLFVHLAVSAQSDMATLGIGKPVERELKGGESHQYGLSMEEGQFLHAVTDQRGIDVVVTLLSPHGNEILKVDSPNGPRGPEPLWFVTDTAGLFTVVVSSLEKNANPGRYEIRVSQLRVATPDDRLFADAKKMGGEVELLAARGKIDDDEGATKRILEVARLYESIQNDMPAKAAGLSEIGKLFSSINDNDRALAYFDQSIALYEASGLKRDAMMAIVASLGSTRSVLDKKARNEKALLLAQAMGDRRSEISAKIEITTQLYYLGDYAAALDTILSALKTAREIGADRALPTIYDSIGNIYTAQANFAGALEAHQLAHQIATAQKNTRALQGTLLNIGNVYEGLGRSDLAIDYYRKALVGFEKISDPAGIAFATSNIGSIYLNIGDYDNALEYFLKAQPMKAQFLAADPTTYYNLGMVYFYKRKFEESTESLSNAIELSKKVRDTFNLASAHNGLSQVYFAQAKYSDAVEQAKLALATAENYGNLRQQWLALDSLGRAYFALGAKKSAKESMEQAVGLIEQLRTGLPKDEGSKLLFYRDKRGPYQFLIRLAINDGRLSDALSLAERLQARTLVDAMQRGTTSITKALTPSERAHETELRAKVVESNLQLAKSNDEAEISTTKANAQQRRLEYEDFQIRLYAAHPELKVHRGQLKPIEVDEAARLISDKSGALVEYVIADDESFVFVITREGKQSAVSFKVYPIQMESSELGRKIERFRTNMASGGLDFHRPSSELYNLLIEPLQEQLAGKTNVIIVADGPLWDLPFQALIDENGKYLAEKIAVSYAPSLTALREMKKRAGTRKPSAGAELLAFGNPVLAQETIERVQRVFMSEKMEPIPEAGRLVNELGKMYGPKRSKVFTGMDAREETAKLEAPKYRIVQFATHGILNNVSPMYSHLVLAQDEKNPKEDGLLEAWELKDLDLKADMVILSACDTARGKISGGEGVIGMTWAAFIAGAPTTVASQWKVESSSTTEFMLEFHRQMLANKKISKAEALRRASLKLMKSAKYRHPSYWAPWILAGDGS